MSWCPVKGEDILEGALVPEEGWVRRRGKKLLSGETPMSKWEFINPG